MNNKSMPVAPLRTSILAPIGPRALMCNPAISTNRKGPRAFEMTLYRKTEIKCANCQASSQQSWLASTGVRGFPDLDDRMPVPARFTMGSWLQECASCGYVAGRLNEEEDRLRAFVDTPEYRKMRSELAALPATDRKFLLRAGLAELAGDAESAFLDTLAAAWLADDRADAEQAKKLRIQASRYLLDREGLRVPLQLQLLDVLRRSACWEEARALLAGLRDKPLEPRPAAIVAFQREKVFANDTKRYTVDKAVKPAG